MFSIPPAIRWFIEKDGLVLFDGKEGKSLKLTYPSAAVWDLFSRHYDRSMITQMMCHMLCSSEPQTDEFIDTCLSGWAEDGWLKEL